jgi:RNase H-fold protein (predicted Holliday junction resolvase)
MSEPVAVPCLGIDIGKKKSGLSFSENGLLVRPLTVVYHLERPALIAPLLLEQVKANAARTVVVGLPWQSDGTLSRQATWVRRVIARLRNSLPGEIVLVEQDERGSTRDGHHLYPDLPDDVAAAVLILQDYLDQHRPHP